MHCNAILFLKLLLYVVGILQFLFESDTNTGYILLAPGLQIAACLSQWKLLSKDFVQRNEKHFMSNQFLGSCYTFLGNQERTDICTFVKSYSEYQQSSPEHIQRWSKSVFLLTKGASSHLNYNSTYIKKSFI
jgi:hypothetical protein